jgi:hypothetical protein
MTKYQDEPDWVNVLLTLYDEERSRFRHDSSDSEYSIPKSHILVGEEGTGLSRDEVDNALMFLRDSGLMKIDFDNDKWEITEKGFSIAHERVMTEKQEDRKTERVKRQNDTNKQIVKLTLAIVFMDAISISISAILNLDEDALLLPADITVPIILTLALLVVLFLIQTIKDYNENSW